ncbi:unnamed protein product [Dracunculus medinensis]|uniref:Uncharacterized protein n=1 Tax=Dracunculus medinensis TaxID=318479 RepID=A0A0N4UPZ5_DRAME|nr:unnamed protein product [Dracunculus medinensis]
MCEFMQNKASFMRKGFNRFAFNIDRIIAKYSQKRNETIFIDMNTMTVILLIKLYFLFTKGIESKWFYGKVWSFILLKSTAKAPYNFNKYAEQTLIRHFGNSVLSAPSNIELDDPEDFREAQKLDQEFEQSFSALNSSRLKCELFVPSQVIGTNQRKSMRLREKLRLPHTPKVNPCFDGCRRTGVNDLSRILDGEAFFTVDSFVIPRISQPYVFGAPVHENHENEQLLVNTTL